LRADREIRKIELEKQRAEDEAKRALQVVEPATKYLSNGWGAGRMNSSYR
jgi:hypothetical protein